MQPEAAPRGTPIAGWVLLAAGAAAGAGGAVFWVLRGNEIATLDAGCRSRVNCPTSLQSDADRGKVYDAVGIGLFATAGVAVAAGGGILLFGGRTQGSASGIRIRAHAGSSGGGVLVEGGF
jgi:hypothetical protein